MMISSAGGWRRSCTSAPETDWRPCRPGHSPAPAGTVSGVRPRLTAVALAAALALLVTGCDFRLMTPPRSGSVRYRDAVFTELTKTADITYGRATTVDGKDQDLQLDVYEPKADTVTRRPAIIWVHGGGFSKGDKTSTEIVDQASTFAKQGYVTVSISYRLAPVGCSVIGPECITAIGDAWHDAQAAVRFLRANADTYGIDVGRIAIGGSSAGAITALNVAYGADNVGTSGNPGYSSKVRAAVSLSGAAILTNPDPGEPAALLFHGTADKTVPYAWAETTITDARTAGLIVESTTWNGDGHVPYGKHRDQILRETSNFLYYLLDAGRAAQ